MSDEYKRIVRALGATTTRHHPAIHHTLSGNTDMPKQNIQPRTTRRSTAVPAHVNDNRKPATKVTAAQVSSLPGLYSAGSRSSAMGSQFSLRETTRSIFDDHFAVGGDGVPAWMLAAQLDALMGDAQSALLKSGATFDRLGIAKFTFCHMRTLQDLDAGAALTEEAAAAAVMLLKARGRFFDADALGREFQGYLGFHRAQHGMPGKELHMHAILAPLRDAQPALIVCEESKTAELLVALQNVS